MNDYANLRRKKRSIWSVVMALALCVALSTSVLLSRLSGFSGQQAQQYIPLTVSSGTTRVTTVDKSDLCAPAQANSLFAPRAVVRLDDPQPRQDEKAWLSITDLELFNVSYENGEGKVTVQSASGDKIIAPGTSNSYTFCLKNTGEFGLDYDIEVKAYFAIQGSDVKVPVQIRLSDYAGNYLIGSADAFQDLSSVNAASGSGSVSAGFMVPYTIEWVWPFEGDDVLDTMLGSYFLETGTEVTFVMEVRTVAEEGGEGGVPSTGDHGLMIPTFVLCVSAGALLFMLLPLCRKREDDHDRK